MRLNDHNDFQRRRWVKAYNIISYFIFILLIKFLLFWHFYFLTVSIRFMVLQRTKLCNSPPLQSGSHSYHFRFVLIFFAPLSHNSIMTRTTIPRLSSNFPRTCLQIFLIFDIFFISHSPLYISFWPFVFIFKLHTDVTKEYFYNYYYN